MIGTIVIAAALQAATPAVAPVADWRAVPVAGGSWIWRAVPGGSEAVFTDVRGAQFALRCTVASRRVSLTRTGAISGAPLVVRTSSGDRTLPWIANLPATDPLLDAIAFSRGKFAVEVAGAPRLVVPAWPEAARAVEDCRK
ncbi:hypothetical protein [uncultured Sphingomonas sp.]|uniref:hypothetical protein n=1 Tax=uncultured Sphingomonas sp. TaxID=158754 RepID=UPI0025F57CF5|nr:hypothetical protein [uncultured Sphingomonas sp.]